MKLNNWHVLENIGKSASGEISAEAIVAAGSPWFDGHFPGQPVLPGIAQLGMVLEVTRNVFGREAALDEVSRVRFRRVLQPAERICIRINPVEGREGVHAFRITAVTDDADVICNGFVRLNSE